MKKLLLILILSSCTTKLAKLEKPFIIVYKSPYYGEFLYQYQDKNGELKTFYESKERYNIGDTIK